MDPVGGALSFQMKKSLNSHEVTSHVLLGLCSLFVPEQSHLCQYYGFMLPRWTQIHSHMNTLGFRPKSIIRKCSVPRDPHKESIDKLVVQLVSCRGFIISLCIAAICCIVNGTGVHWPHVFRQANNESVEQTANTVRQQEDKTWFFFKMFDITVYGFNVGSCKRLTVDKVTAESWNWAAEHVTQHQEGGLWIPTYTTEHYLSCNY